MLLWSNCVQWVKLVPAHSNSARLTASLTSQLHFQGSALALGRPICPQTHCTQYDPLVLGGELYLRFLSLPCPVSQNSHKQVVEVFVGFYISEEILVWCATECERDMFLFLCHQFSAFLAFSESIFLDNHITLFQMCSKEGGFLCNLCRLWC